MRFVWIVAGWVQAAAGVLVGAYGYMAWHTPPAVGGDHAQMFVHGASSFWYFLVATPIGWLALWLFGEGLMRVLSAAMDQPFSTLPVVMVRAARRLGRRKQLPADELIKRLISSSGDLEIVIDTAHDYDWHALTTVEIEGKLYRVCREAGASLRPHRYRLTPIPPEHVVRTVTRYPPPR